jgi:hypothetical protein
MIIDPHSLIDDLDRLEEIEKATLRLVTQAIYDFRSTAAEIFANESDLAQDIGEDITREALDVMGVSRVNQRLFGKIDYKRARYVFLPEYAIKQALFVDSKAEKNGAGVARIQTSQISMRVRQERAGQDIDEAGKLPQIISIGEERFLTTTAFVKYRYKANGQNELVHITVAMIPNGMLQSRYNPSCQDSIWNAGPNSPQRGEEFRTRLSFKKLIGKARWRVQHILPAPAEYNWQE